jgi:SufS family cysteine desulfurase
MTTVPNSEPASAVPEPAAGEAAHSDLVAKLVAEAFSGFSRGAKPTTKSTTPSEIPSVSKLPDLSGTDASSAVPPVHPSAQPAAPKLSEPEKTPSGAHAPDSGDSYAFGEPRCNGDYRPKGKKSDTKTANNNSLIGLPEAESVAAPEYYFLRGGNPSGKSPLTCQSYPKNSTPIPKFDIEGVRRDFPALHQLVNGKPLIWLDNAATTHKPQTVIDATSKFYSRDNSNIHRAAHALAARSTELFEAGREKVRKFLGAADAKEIVFVRGTTEAINLVAQSYGRKNIGAGDEIIVSELEHHANIVPWQLLAEQTGAVVKVIPINDRGELILEEYVKLLTGKTKFVSVAHVSNSLGTINSVEQIIALAHARGIPVLIDGAQSTPHLPVNVSALDADFYVFSGHKIFAPTGIGALYGKAALLEAMPPWQGGGHMIKDVRFEKTVYQNAPEKFEAGTPDIAGVVGLGAAIDYLFKVGIPGIAAYEHALLEYAQSALATIPGLRPIGTATTKASVLSFVIFPLRRMRMLRHD